MSMRDGNTGSMANGSISTTASWELVLKQWAVKKFDRLRVSARLDHLKIPEDVQDYMEDLSETLIKAGHADRVPGLSTHHLERVFLHIALDEIAASTKVPDLGGQSDVFKAAHTNPMSLDLKPRPSGVAPSSTPSRLSTSTAPTQRDHTKITPQKPHQRKAQSNATPAAQKAKAKIQTTLADPRQSIIARFVSDKVKALEKLNRLSRLEDNDEIKLLASSLNDELLASKVAGGDLVPLTDRQVGDLLLAAAKVSKNGSKSAVEHGDARRWW